MPSLVEQMAFTGSTPWHRLGTPVDHVMTAQEAITLGGLDWSVLAEPVFTANKTEVPGLRVTVRQDRGEILGIVSDRYRVLQNNRAFGFFDRIVDEGEAIYHTVGSLDRGKRIWLLAQLPGYIEPLPGDLVQKFLLLANSHDGSLAVRIGFTPVRVVCQNTLSLALRDLANSYTIRHRGANFSARLDDAVNALGLARKWYDQAGDLWQTLAQRQTGSKGIDRYLEQVFPLPKKPEGILEILAWEQARDRMLVTRQTAQRFLEEGRGSSIPGVRGSLWGTVNAVCEWADHVFRGSDQRHLNSIWFGERAKFKEKAFATILEMAKN